MESAFIPPTFSKTDWSLHRKGPIDQARHKEKLKEAIKSNLGDIISDEAIITSDGNRIVRVPIYGLELPHFRYDPYKKEHAGQGKGDSKVGDVVGQIPDAGPGKGKGAGDEPGIDYYEAEITIDELAEMIFEDLHLPNLKPKVQEEVESEEAKFSDVRKHGIMSNLDKRRTIIQAIKRRAIAEKEPRFKNIKDDDLRFKTWKHEIQKQVNAVVIAMRDISGSMGEFEKYITRSLYFWMVRFLRQKYKKVEITFIVHHTEAKEVDEEAFFKLGESGGTRASSAYELALDVIQKRYNPSRWNIYPFHFSDGDNWGEVDNRKCVELANKLLEVCNIFGYGEIQEGDVSRPMSTLMNAFESITSPHFVGVTIKDRADVYPALKEFFGKRELPPDG